MDSKELMAGKLVAHMLENDIRALRTENAALKEQLKEIETTLGHFNSLHVPEQINTYKETITALKEQVNALEDKAVILRATIKAQEHWQEQVVKQAAVIEQMRDALHLAANNMNYVGAKNWDIIANALLLQPSPEILQDRDKRVAEACAKVCIEQSEGIARAAPVRDCSESSVRESAFRIRNGAWERHL